MSPKNTKIIPLVEIKNFSKRYGKHVVLDYTSFQIMPGERLSIIGPNGAGKTTLAKIVAGTEKTTAGKIKRSIPLSEIGSQYQNSTFPDGYTAEELVYYYSSIVQKENKINDVENMLKVFGFDNIRHHKANILSFGQKQKLNILISLLSQPKLLILDEFTNGLDVLSEKSIVDFLTEYIKRHNIAILLITHNMADAVKFSDKIVLVNDQKIKLIANSEDVTMSKNIVKEFASFIKTDEEKVQISPTFGMKSDRILSSSDKFYKNMTKYMSAQGSNLIDSKTEACKLIEVTKTYGKKQVLKGINLSLPYDATMAIVGPNGAGKSTLIELIALTKRQTTGYIGWGFSNYDYEVKLDIGAQFQETSFPSYYKLKEIVHLIKKSSKFSLIDSDYNEIVHALNLKTKMNNSFGQLSGGQKQKFNVLITLLQRPKLLILDELTEGLDIHSTEMVLKIIKTYQKNTRATLLIVSHTPYEIKELTDKIIFLDNGKITKMTKITKRTNVKKLMIEEFLKTGGDR